MDKDEIKQMYSMMDVIQRYGFHPNRAGFICCPFHTGDRTASMKIYPDSFYCFACGAVGDIFTFVQRMENTDFKGAFLALGGSYPERREENCPVQTKNDRRHEIRDQLQQRQTKERERETAICLARAQLRKASEYASLMAAGVRYLEPFSDLWCFCANELEPAFFRFECLFKEVRNWSK